MYHASPADELAEIRADIARLNAREAVLHDAFLTDPKKGAVGRWSQVEVVQASARIFDTRLLPEAIRDDPRYWRDLVTMVVRCREVRPTAARPGWPIRAVQAQAALH